MPGSATDGARATTTRTPAIQLRDRVSAGRAVGLFLTAGGLLSVIFGVTVPGFAGHGPVLAVSLAVAVAIAAMGIACLRAPGRVSVVVLVGAPVVATVLVGALNLATRDSSTGSQLFLLWPVVYAASFLDLRRNVLVLSTVVVVEAMVMGVLESPSRATIDAGSLALAFTLAALAILAQRHRVGGLLAALESQAREDPVTALPNRRAFDEQLERAFASARRSATPLSLLILDVDRFKDVNDQRGHPAGDAALRSVAEALRASTRGADGIARLGGDEFAVLLADCEPVDALRVADAVRSEVSLRTAATGERITVSVGAATTHDGQGTATALLAASDAALYEAKLHGGDQVAAARSEVPTFDR
jgi:diguanylate cyclase (GGDEF)-like protein